MTAAASTPDHEDPTHYVVTRTVPAPPSAVFSLLTDPARHHETEPADWVRGPLESDPAPLTEVGQVFGIEMFHENAGGRYKMHNRVIAFEQDRTIAWEPGQYGPGGELGTGGWTWRYDLAPIGQGGQGSGGGGIRGGGSEGQGISGGASDGGGSGGEGEGSNGQGTRVTLTYDWSGVPAPLREEFGVPPFPPSFLDESLAALERAVTAQ